MKCHKSSKSRKKMRVGRIQTDLRTTELRFCIPSSVQKKNHFAYRAAQLCMRRIEQFSCLEGRRWLARHSTIERLAGLIAWMCKHCGGGGKDSCEGTDCGEPIKGFLFRIATTGPTLRRSLACCTLTCRRRLFGRHKRSACFRRGRNQSQVHRHESISTSKITLRMLNILNA